MAATMVLDPKLASSSPPPTLSSPYSTMDIVHTDSKDELYTRLKSLERQIEFIKIQEEYVKDEQKHLKRELLRSQKEVKQIQSVSLGIGQFMEMIYHPKLDLTIDGADELDPDLSLVKGRDSFLLRLR